MTSSTLKSKSTGRAGQQPSIDASGRTSAGRVLRTLLACGLLGIAILAIYGRTSKFGVTDLDDDNLIRIFSSRHYGIADALHSNAFMQPNGKDFYRPIQSITFIIDANISGANPSSYHLTNITLHWLVVCSFLWLLLVLGVNRLFSFSLALLYAVHPLFVQAVAWIPGRGDLLLGLFGLLAFISLVRFRASGAMRLLPVHAAAFFCATLSKESGIVLPLLFAAYLFLAPGKKMSLKIGVLVPVWILIGAGYLWLHREGMASLPVAGMFGFAPLAANLRTVPEMLGYLILPFDIPVMPGFSLPVTMIGLIAAAGLALALGIRYRLRSPLVILGALWYVSLSIPGMMYRHEFGSHAYDFLNHRSYLPIVGIFLVLAEAVPPAWYLPGKRLFFASASAVVLVAGALAWHQCNYFADPKAFFDQAVRTNPKSALAWNNRATIKMEQGDLSGSLRDCDAAIRLFPAYAEAHINRGNALLMLGDAKGAAVEYSRAIDLKPDNINAYDNRARAKDQLGDTPGVIADLTQAIALNPLTADRFFFRGGFEEKIGDTTKAILDYSKAIELDPGSAEVYAKRGGIFARRGDSSRAAADFRKAVALDPRLGGALHSGQ